MQQDSLATDLAHQPAQSFDDYCRARNSANALPILAAFILPGVIVAAIASALLDGATLATAGTVVAVAATLFVYRLVANRVYAKYEELSRLVEQHIGCDVLEATPSSRFLVGLSPADRPRQYDNHSLTWDSGYLVLFKEGLVYLGTKTSFALPREFVREIGAGPGAVERWYPDRLYVVWSDPKDTARRIHTLNFAARACRTLRAGRIVADEMIETARQWHSRRGSFPALPPKFAALPLPELYTGSATHPSHAISPRGLQIMAAMICGGSLGTLWLLRFVMPLDAAAWWIAPCAGFFALLWNIMPIYFSRDEAVEIR